MHEKGWVRLYETQHQYYPTHEAYLSALAEAMKEEYDAIVGAGFLLQLDCPDLGVSRVRGEDWREDYRVLHIQALNQAVPTGVSKVPDQW